jgi:phosphoglycerate dehydrogenase-like enzyme
VLITPHIAGGTTVMLPRMATLVRDQLERLRDGRPLRNVVQR